MPTAFTETPTEAERRRKRWTRAECQEIVDAGIVDGKRLELIGGEIIEKERKNSLALAAHELYVCLSEVFGTRFVLMYAPIDVSPADNLTNEPEPDITVLSREFTEFTDANPQPQDLQLVVEVSDAYVGFDLTMKSALYARAGIIEYWVLDISGRRMIVHRDPQGGRYMSVLAYSIEEAVSPLKARTSQLRVADMFG
jgi:Uma2 family endonuclease